MTDDMQERPDARTRILQAARTLLETKSAQFFKVRDIADRAGVSPALVLRYFKSKDELTFLAILEGLVEVGTPAMRQMVADNPNLTPHEFLLQLMTTDLQNGHRTRDLMTMEWWWSTVEEEQFQAAIAERDALFKTAILRQARRSPCAPTPELDAVLFLYNITYKECLRRAGVMRLSPEQAMEVFEARTAVLSPLLKKCLADLRAAP